MREAQPSGMPELARRLGSLTERSDLLPGLNLSNTAMEILNRAVTPANAFRYIDLDRRLEDLQQVIALLSRNPAVEMLYSVKTNPNPEVLKIIASRGIAAEVISLGEARATVAQGCDSASIIANGPAKGLQDARWPPIRIGFADSIEECEAWAANVEALRSAMFGVRLRVSAHGSRFGVDVSLGAARRRLFALLEKLPTDLHLGFSFHMSPSAIGFVRWRECLHGLLDIIEEAPSAVRSRTVVLDLGGGWEREDQSILLELLLPELQERLVKIPLSIKSIYLEFGRALVQDLGVYVCSVVEMRPQAKQIVIDGSALDLPDLISAPHGMIWLTADGIPHRVAQGEYAILGRTCMESDVLLGRVSPPPSGKARLLIGDCGAYDSSMEPNFGLGKLSRSFIPI